MRLGPMSFALLLVCVSCGRSTDTPWSQSRSEYCSELDLLGRSVTRQLAHDAESIGHAAQVPPEQRTEACHEVELDLHELAGRIQGFETCAHVLARARPADQTVEQAGFVLQLGDDEALRAFEASSCVRPALDESVSQLATAQKREDELFSAGLARCKAIGWTSHLP